MLYKFEDYEIKVFYSDEDEAFIATLSEMPTLSGIGESPEEAFKELKIAFEAGVEFYKEQQESMPIPFSRRKYSGQFNVRVPSSLHESLVKEAKEENTSLNQLVLTLLASGLKRFRAS